jgi:hypothetical protein
MDGKVEVECFVGVDLAKARVDVHVRPGGRAFEGTTDPEGLSAWSTVWPVAAPTDRARGERRLRRRRGGGPGSPAAFLMKPSRIDHSRRDRPVERLGAGRHLLHL